MVKAHFPILLSMPLSAMLRKQQPDPAEARPGEGMSMELCLGNALKLLQPPSLA